MREFKTPEAFAQFLTKNIAGLRSAIEQGLGVAAEVVEKEAKSEFGVYQTQNMGPFSAWPELAASTKAERVSKGYSENEPLYREGDLMESIRKEVEATKAVVGSDDDVMVWQELGTWDQHIPARPVLGPAGFRKARQVAMILAESVFYRLIGKPLIRRSYKEEAP